MTRFLFLNAVSEIRTISIKNSDGSPTNNLVYNMREDNSCKWLFIAHASLDEYNRHDYRENTLSQNIRIYIDGEYTPKLYNTLDGNICEIAHTHQNGQTVIEYSLYTNDSCYSDLTAKSALYFYRKQMILVSRIKQFALWIKYHISVPSQMFC